MTIKQVLRVSVNGVFRQYLKLSEVRYVNAMLKEKEGNKVEVQLLSMTDKTYKVFFH